MSILKYANPLLMAAGQSLLPTGARRAVQGTAMASQVAAPAAGGKSSISAQRNGASQNISKKKKSIKQPKPAQPQKPPKTPGIPKLSHRVHKAYDDAIRMEKAASGIGDKMIDGAAFAGAATLGGAAIGGAVYGAKKVFNKTQTEKVWQELKKRRPDLTKTQKDRENFEVLQQFSPDLASNITTLESYMERVNSQMMMPHEFIGDLSDIQKTRDQNSFGNSIRDYGVKSYGEGLKVKTGSMNRKVGGPTEDKSWVGEFKPKNTNSRVRELDSLSSESQYRGETRGRYTKKEVASAGSRLDKTAQLKEELEYLDPRKL